MPMSRRMPTIARIIFVAFIALNFYLYNYNIPNTPFAHSKPQIFQLPFYEATPCHRLIPERITSLRLTDKSDGKLNCELTVTFFIKGLEGKRCI